MCACVPILFTIMISFQPETPSYLIKKGKYDQAKKSLEKLRGKNYNVEAELSKLEGLSNLLVKEVN